ncbi:MAG: hypothetical protein JSU57_04710 [Candidatus Heimdallarchaeota archaeon]|nr:MAG: hypothetical protein JSU57_04710 [Candidatus Heimdallarchaeota archaeon]
MNNIGDLTIGFEIVLADKVMHDSVEVSQQIIPYFSFLFFFTIDYNEVCFIISDCGN